MSPDELLQLLEKKGIKMSRRTLLRLEKEGLIPEPKRGSHGKGRGRYTDYPDETVRIVTNAWLLSKLKGKQLKVTLEKIAELSGVQVNVEYEHAKFKLIDLIARLNDIQIEKIQSYLEMRQLKKEIKEVEKIIHKSKEKE